MRSSRIWLAVVLLALGLQLTGQLYCVLSVIVVTVALIALLIAILWLPLLAWCALVDAMRDGPPVRTVRLLSATLNAAGVISDRVGRLLPHAQSEGWSVRRRNWTDMVRETREAVAVVLRQGGPHA